MKRTRQAPVVWWRRLSVPQRWLAGAGAVLVVAIVLMVSLWPDPVPESREREYLQFTACLLTPADGVRDPASEPVWKAMQDASLQTRAKVQYLEISGAQTVDNAVTFLNSLAQGGCDLIFAAGDLPVRAVVKGAPTFPAERFVTVGTSVTAPNVSTVDAVEPHDGVVRTITEAVATARR